MTAIALFAREDDPTTLHLERLLQERGAEVRWATLARIAEGRAARFDGERFSFDGRSLSDVGGYVLRHFPSETAQLSSDPALSLTTTEWWRRGIAQKERSQFARSLLYALDVAGARGVNPHLLCAPFDLKPFQLHAFARAGLPIPKTCVTNDPDEARAFVASVGEAIAKPVAGGAPTRLVDEKAMASLDAIRSSPVIFQERVRGPDVRVTVVAGEIVSAVEIPTSESDPIDYRASAAWREGEVSYLEHPLDDDTRALCSKVADLCHHVLSGIDLKRRADGSYALLEANAAPVYLDIERQTGAPISARVVDHLLGASG